MCAIAHMADLIVPQQPQRSRYLRYAPFAVSPDNRAGSEADLETRIDVQPLPSDAGISDSVAAARAMVDKSGGRALLLVQSSSPAAGTFVRMPSVIVLAGAQDWDRDSLRSALGDAAGHLWTTSQLGAAWVTGTSGSHPIERLDGLGTLMFATQGQLVFLSNDARLLAGVLNRAGTAPPAGAFTYAAGFRHSRERSNYERVMTALDFTPSRGNRPDGAPAFFSGNIASLSRVLSKVIEIHFTEQEKDTTMVQTVRYQMAQ